MWPLTYGYTDKSLYNLRKLMHIASTQQLCPDCNDIDENSNQTAAGPLCAMNRATRLSLTLEGSKQQKED